MSRIGIKPITIPAGVEVKLDGNVITVSGKNGTLTHNVNPRITVKVEGTEITVSRSTESNQDKSLHGLTRTLVANMVNGVANNYTKELEVNGVGYRVAKQGNDLVMNLGYSHQVIMPEIDGITIEVPNPNKIVVIGPDKQKVGQFAAEIREKRPPEPYKGKGIKYVDEVIRRKEGKAGKGKK